MNSRRNTSFPQSLRIAALLVFAACTTTVGLAQRLAADSATFSVTYKGKNCGQVSASITPSAAGYTLTAQGKVQFEKTQFAFSRTGQLDAGLNSTNELLSGSVNGSAVVFQSFARNGRFEIQISANGKKYSNTLPYAPNTVFLPDFDPTALQALALQTTRSNKVQALIPKQNGLLSPVQLSNQSQEQGTLNGTPVSLRHFTATINGIIYEIFLTTSGLLAQEEIPQQGFALVRTGFQLTPSSTAGKAPEQEPDQEPQPEEEQPQ